MAQPPVHTPRKVRTYEEFPFQPAPSDSGDDGRWSRARAPLRGTCTGGADQHRRLRQRDPVPAVRGLRRHRAVQARSRGSFTGTSTTWTLSHGARVVAGGPSGSSLYLSAGASAQSPFTCVDAADPTFRFFGRNDGLLSTFLVQVVYNEPLLGPVALPVGVFALSGSWQPSATMLTASVVQGLLSNGTAQVAIRFTELTGASQMDNVFVDPRMHW